MENKFIVAKDNKVGKMRLFNEIDAEGYTLERFLLEFESLQKDDSIDEIEILINSLGGSVFKGFPIITAINASPKPVTTIVDTIAASMAALIFLSGSKRRMYNYSQLMIHPAYKPDGSTDDSVDNINQSIFDHLKAVTKRAKEKIKGWLSKDTWFTAAQAIENNLATEIIKGKMPMVGSYQHEIKNLVASGQYSETANNNLKIKYEKSMEEILDILSLKSDATDSDVKKKVEEIKNALAIKEQELVNRDSKITELEAKLKVHEDAEKAKRENEISSLVEDAFTSRQINAEGKATWKNLLSVDFESASKAIKALAKTEKVSEIINTDSETKQVEVTLSPLQQLMQNPF